MRIGISGLGFVGNAMKESFSKIYDVDLIVYDKFKNGGIGKFSDLLDTDILFLSLPTLFNGNEYDKGPIYETLSELWQCNYKGLIVIKSTVEPGTCEQLAGIYELNIIHNPEFLTARSAIYDFHNQKHIVLGKTSSCNNDIFEKLINFYSNNYNAEISICSSDESESMKLFLNSFYATKVQFFTEIYLMCDSLGMNYNRVKELMLKNGWINDQHTNIPGPDGNVSYGGMCFPKDTKALLSFMRKNNLNSNVLAAVVDERDKMRND